ncbi:VWA domain-containing protein [Variovorax dokdonensis]|uniref:VWA domain-containing protein n=1 Tax=Variovorax dokdonensis TaxID=344883 RepID=A0ABT7NGX9_9BURK|nr:VWA domain-containing protein [Variovorax dokdonensis]MDM0047199.1 VWA domain-containing protein [Variovorax dokdonensis]
MDAISQFHFLRPWWLLALVAAAVLLWAVGRRDNVRRRWREVISPHLLDALVVEPGRGRRLRPVHLIAALISVGALAAAGPTWEREPPPFMEDKAPLAIAIDMSPTMNASDVSPTRLERAKLKVRALLAQRSGARTAIYAYAGSTHLVLPLTDDAALIQTFVDALQTNIMPVAGKNTAAAVRQIDAALAKEDTPGSIVFMTDGVEASAFDAIKTHADGAGAQLVVLAFGTERGGAVRGPDGQPGGLARLDVDALKRLKSDTGVPVATVTLDSDDDVQWVQRHVQSHLQRKVAESGGQWKEFGWWLLWPTVLLGAMWFRKGWTIRWIASWLLGLMLGFGPGGTGMPVAAQELVTSRAADNAAASSSLDLSPPPWRFVDLWLTRDQQGRRAYEKGQYAEAARLFDDPMWRGLASFRAGQFSDAAQLFAEVDTAPGHFNEGDALAMLGKYDEAALAFQRALKKRPGWKAAQDNLQLVHQLAAQKNKQDEDGDEESDLDPDEIKFDDRGKKGKTVSQPGPGQGDDAVWMRNIQTSPTMLLARKFALQAARPEQGAGGGAESAPSAPATPGTPPGGGAAPVERP